jgi:hypothetical protein
LGNADGAGTNAGSGAVYKAEGMILANCTVNNNNAIYGGAMVVSGNQVLTIVNSTFIGNTATTIGAIIDLASATASVACTNTVFRRNFSGSNGAIFCSGASPVFVNCIFDSNTISSTRYGFHAEGNCNPKFVNCIVYHESFVNLNTAQTNQLTLTNCIVWNASAISGAAALTYCCLPSSYSGTGNVAGNPLFVDPAAGDFHIRAGSPCIDKANGTEAPTLDFEGKARVDFLKVTNADSYFADIGPFECTTPNIVPVITSAHVSGGFLNEQISIGLDSLVVVDADNTYPNDFQILVGAGNYSIVSTAKAVIQILPFADTTSNVTIPIRVCDLADTSNVYNVTVLVKRRIAYVDASATGLNSGASWKNAYTNLVMAINLTPATSELWVAKGTYFPVLSDTSLARANTFALVSNGAPLYGGFAGTETLRSQRNWRINETILSGDIGRKGDSTDNCFHVVTGATGAILDGFVITLGNADSVNAGSMPLSGGNLFVLGGGMMNNRTSPIINNCTFRRNYAFGGGAMFNYASACPVITNCIFCYNYATDTAVGVITQRNAGGAIYDNWGSMPVITNCVFYRNYVATNNAGAAIFHYWGDTLKVTNCTFYENGGAKNSLPGFAVEWAEASILNSILIGTSIGNLDSRGPTAISYSCIPVNLNTFTNGPGNIHVTPGFVDTANNNFHLKANSLCIDQASGAFAPATDIEGNARYDHPNCDNVDASFADMGAYEYVIMSTRATLKSVSGMPAPTFSFDITSQPGTAALRILYCVPAYAGIQNVTFSIFNAMGVCIARLADGAKAPGKYELSFNTATIAKQKLQSGYYVCRMQADNTVLAKKFIVLR